MLCANKTLSPFFLCFVSQYSVQHFTLYFCTFNMWSYIQPKLVVFNVYVYCTQYWRWCRNWFYNFMYSIKCWFIKAPSRKIKILSPFNFLPPFHLIYACKIPTHMDGKNDMNPEKGSKTKEPLASTTLDLKDFLV